MDKFGLVRVAACSPCVKPADVDFNVSQIENILDQCIGENVKLAVFPELCLTGYTCADLFEQDLLLERAIAAIFAFS